MSLQRHGQLLTGLMTTTNRLINESIKPEHAFLFFSFLLHKQY